MPSILGPALTKEGPMDTRLPPDDERRLAVARCVSGEDPTTIAASLGRSRRWVYKWLARHRTGDSAWAADRSRRPWTHPLALPARVEAAVESVRRELYNEGLLYGAQNIRWRLEELELRPLPSVRTINRTLARRGLTHRRTRRYVPRGRPTPRWRPTGPTTSTKWTTSAPATSGAPCGSGV